MYNIGLIGCGFVGGAIKNAHDLYGIKINVYDLAKGYDTDFGVIKNCDYIFIAVPSPTSPSGECDTSILEETLERLEGSDAVIISKVTAPPSVYKKLQQKYKNLVGVPEFLVAATAQQDYLDETFCIIGGDQYYCKLAEQVIRLTQRNIQTVKYCKIEEASLTKYTINCFLALKVSFLNQINDYCQTTEINYNAIKELIKSDDRLGNSHFDVPGPDGQRGFAGACFPKDTSALFYEGNSQNIDFSILNSAIQYNKTLRK